MALNDYSFLPFGAGGISAAENSGTGLVAPRWYSGNAIPTAGTFSVGDTIFNTSPGAVTSEISRSTIGWVCSAAGTPGTWQPILSSGAAATQTTTATSGTLTTGFRVILINPATTGTYSLPDCTTVLPTTFLTIKNIASGSTTFTALATNSYADAAAITLAQNAFVTMETPGSSTLWYKVG